MAENVVADTEGKSLPADDIPNPIPNGHIDPNAVIRLNVGGVEYVTTARTLALAGPSSPLSRLSPSLPGSSPPFLDRDGTLFKHVLSFLRNGVLPSTRAVRESLSAEARALHIPALQDALRAREIHDAKFGVLLFERVTILENGIAVDGHLCVAGRAENPSRWFSGFSMHHLVSQFQERIEKEVSDYSTRTGLALLGSSSTTTFAPADVPVTGQPGRKGIPQRLVHVHTVTCTFGTPGVAQ